MTGYGKATAQVELKKITVEARSLNSKSIDLNVRIPAPYRDKELEIRQLVTTALGRGKVDLSLTIEETGVQNQTINIAVLQDYIAQLKKTATFTQDQEIHLLDIASRFPDVFTVNKQDADVLELQAVLNTTYACILNLNAFRNSEGEALQQEFQLRISNINNLLASIIEEDKTRISGIRERLQKAVSDLKETVDANRFEQELIYYLEKYDITEEKVRLQNHLHYFIETMNEPESQGRKLGFISQEIGREINTIGSKSNHAAMQQLVVQMKDELEKIKEQLLNVL